MWSLIIPIALFLAHTAAHWATHYSFQEGVIYLQLKNDDLVALNFSMSGFDGLSGSSLAEVNIEQNQEVFPLTAPPQNSTMFVSQKHLYAFSGAVDESLSTFDKCGNGVFQLLKYEAASDSWVYASDNMTFSGVENVSFYQDSTYLTSLTSSEVYVYGGVCTATGEVSSRLLSFDMETMLFANISTSTEPQGFYGGVSVWAPSPLQLFVVGGRSEAGWLNMYQLATWNFQSGWLFQSVLKNGTTVLSRTNGLVLPVFSVLSDDTEETFLRNYNPQAVLVLGGEASGQSEAAWAKLLYEDNEWSWQSLELGLEDSDILGAAVIFDTLVVVNGSSQTAAGKRLDSSYHLNLYDINSNFSLVDDLQSNTVSKSATQAASSTSVSKSTKILVGTLVPLSALAIIFGIAMYVWRRKVALKDTASLAGPMDYQLGHYRTQLDQQYSLLGSRPLDLYQHVNDTSSTLEGASIDSWVRKRQEYDASHGRPYARHSYLALNETLGSRAEEFTDELTLLSPPPAVVSPEGSPQKNALPVRISQLRSFLYSQTPPQLPMLQRKSRLDPGFLGLGEGLGASALAESEGEVSDENLDVQVLVSSKRKSVLRVMNPDADTAGEGVRLRNPSK
ncbi:hypothetical protein METBIDRAFT_73601 [Metschnikowia bicuspidata var. bicuspidata NRRL YB-4993]|uniref:Galactose oxidase n=1 Tax=Metschnikowia bicuspidata var. bicuspidata NRRL YB-4993 TaxID=869754 RepID=A0A1A0H6H3_9ASCO|nr:hypothetical protein METBIDRAFT_73601 [Metschnikowia bicuspidata var. bicuspidata NRRL YB-4993]OBA19507.1 hypothetical protein METBIDRAFT_73601 [Metschnikowia bicuspidata var. bicuspidata NRRL YB-4993]